MMVLTTTALAGETGPVSTERLAPRQMAGLLAAFLALTYAFQEGFTSIRPGQWKGDGLAILAAFLWGATTLVVRTTRLATAAAEKTLFTLKLQSFEATAKPKVIKEIKNLLGLSLVDSKKFVESAPKQMKESVPKDDAEKIVATMKELGAVVTME